MSAVQCSACGAVFAGTRTEARRAMWEPSSTHNQWAIDEGPLTCSDCVGRLLDDLLAAMRAWARAN